MCLHIATSLDTKRPVIGGIVHFGSVFVVLNFLELFLTVKVYRDIKNVSGENVLKIEKESYNIEVRVKT